MRPVAVLFAKAPVPGRVKTRLCPPLDAGAAADLHSAFVRDMISSATHLAKTVDLELSTDIVTEAWPDVLTARSVQAGGDLGSRLLHALTRAVAEEIGRAHV